MTTYTMYIVLYLLHTEVGLVGSHISLTIFNKNLSRLGLNHRTLITCSSQKLKSEAV